MEFGQSFICNICKKEPVGDYHRYTSDIGGMDLVFYTCQGDCDKEFSGEYVEPFKPIENRFEILDL